MQEIRHIMNICEELLEKIPSQYDIKINVRFKENIDSIVSYPIMLFEDGEYRLQTDWGVSAAAPRNGYLVIYGPKEGGGLDANILTVGTPSFANYYVVTEEGKLGETLQEQHDRTVKNTRKA